MAMNLSGYANYAALEADINRQAGDPAAAYYASHTSTGEGDSTGSATGATLKDGTPVSVTYRPTYADGSADGGYVGEGGSSSAITGYQIAGISAGTSKDAQNYYLGSNADGSISQQAWNVDAGMGPILMVAALCALAFAPELIAGLSSAGAPASAVAAAAEGGGPALVEGGFASLPAGGMTATGEFGALGSTAAGGASGTLGSGLASAGVADVGAAMGIGAGGIVPGLGTGLGMGAGAFATGAASVLGSQAAADAAAAASSATAGSGVAGAAGVAAEAAPLTVAEKIAAAAAGLTPGQIASMGVSAVKAVISGATGSGSSGSSSGSSGSGGTGLGSLGGAAAIAAATAALSGGLFKHTPINDMGASASQNDLSWQGHDLMAEWKNYMFPQMQGQLAKTGAAADAFQNTMNTQSAKDYNWADTYHDDPILKNMRQQATDYNTDGNIERQSALAMGDVNTAFGGQQQQLAQQLNGFGIDPTSGRYQGQMQAAGVQQAAAAAAAGSRARDAAVQLGWQKQLDALGATNANATTVGNFQTLGQSAAQAGLKAQNDQLGNINTVNTAQNATYGVANTAYNDAGAIGTKLAQIQSTQDAADDAGKGKLLGAGLSAFGGTGGVSGLVNSASNALSGIGTGISKLFGSGSTPSSDNTTINGANGGDPSSTTEDYGT